MQPLTTPISNPSRGDLLVWSTKRRRELEDEEKVRKQARIDRQVNLGRFLWTSPTNYLSIDDVLQREKWMLPSTLDKLNEAFNLVSIDRKNKGKPLAIRIELAVCAFVAKMYGRDVVQTHQDQGAQAPFDGYFDSPKGRRYIEVKMLSQQKFLLPANEVYFWDRQAVMFFGVVFAHDQINACISGWTRPPYIEGDFSKPDIVTSRWLDDAIRRNWR